MSVAMEMTKVFLDAKGMHYQAEDDYIRLSFGDMDHLGGVEIIVIFDDNDRTVSIKSFNLCTVPEEKKDRIYKICSDINERFRWATFFVDEDDNTITVQDDAVIQADTSGDEIFELIMRMVNIIDEAYPTLMKGIWN